MNIEIFGTGCANCARLERNVREVVAKLGIQADIFKIEDFETLIRRGITATPGLVIDDVIVSLGRVPQVAEIEEMIENVKKDAAPRPSFEINVINPTCGCETTGTMLFPCSGGSNVGQISNDVAKMLISEGIGKFSCLAGIGAHSENFIKAAKKAQKVVAIDGCGSKCALKTLQH
ncbi:MAG: MTH895/ArsE family thioredoxin-like protein, partial [Methanomassiliicoccales archaeon]